MIECTVHGNYLKFSQFMDPDLEFISKTKSLTSHHFFMNIKCTVETVHDMSPDTLAYQIYASSRNQVLSLPKCHDSVSPGLTTAASKSK